MREKGTPQHWSTLKKLIWLQAILGGGGSSGQLVTVTGLSPLTLVNALAEPIKSLTQFGKCVQTGTPTPHAPVWPSINNGTVKAWTVREIPLAINTDEIGAIDKDTGAVNENSYYRITEPIFVPAGDYNAKVTYDATYAARSFRVYAYAEDGTPLYICVNATQQAGEQVYPFTISADCYIRVSYRYAGNSDISVEAVTPIVYVDGTPEVLTVAGQTATVPDLYAVGDYADEAEIIGGAVTRKVGVKVFDGTETPTAMSTAGAYRFSGASSGIENLQNTMVLCTHYKPESPSKIVANMDDLAVKTNTTANNNIYFKDTSCQTAADLQAKFAAQYAAGTPVVVWYPLAEEVTEHTAPQPLHTAEGTTIIDVESPVGSVELEAEYKAGAA